MFFLNYDSLRSFIYLYYNTKIIIRSEEHTSELQSRGHIVCRLLLEKKNVKVVAEGANMPCTSEAIDAFIENGILFGLAQAVNGGGVACSRLRMAQDSTRSSWNCTHE